MRVLLVNPPQRYYDRSQGFNIYVPLSLLYLAGSIRDLCTVEILDCLVTDLVVKKIEGATVYGTPAEKIEARIREFNPDVVGISVPFSAQCESAKEVGKICRRINTGIKIVVGGPDVSVRYESLLKEGWCDFCVVGEGEVAFREYLESCNSGESVGEIEGLAYLENGAVRYRPRRFLRDLDSLPYPAYDLVDLHGYMNNPHLYQNRGRWIRGKSISMITSRGCPYHCIFCSIHLHMGREYRFHSPEYVIDHIRYCRDRYGIKNFHFEDDNISLSRKRFELILDGIIDRKLDIQWDTPNGVRVDTLEFSTLKKIKLSGCKELTIAIESGNQRILNSVIRKKTSLDAIQRVVRECRQLKISLSAFYVIGFPGETIADMRTTIDLAIKLLASSDVFPIMLIATPLYGTELYKICAEEGYIKENLTDKDFALGTQFYGEPLISTGEFSADDLKSLISYYRSRVAGALVRFAIRHPVYSAKSLKNSSRSVINFLRSRDRPS
jgi:anaerobic magnesium-protoporphyrin IX monomethyl ester cyclase